MITTKFESVVVAIMTRLRGERGAALVEYALLVALLAVASIGAIEFLGDSAASKMSAVGGSIGGV